MEDDQPCLPKKRKQRPAMKYKQYLDPNSTYNVPRTIAWRLRNAIARKDIEDGPDLANPVPASVLPEEAQLQSEDERSNDSKDMTCEDENDAITSETEAVISEDEAMSSEEEAVISEDEAITSEDEGKSSEDDAMASEMGAETDQNAAMSSDNEAVPQVPNDYDRKFGNSNLTIGEAYVAIFSFIVKAKLSEVDTSHLLSLLHLLINSHDLPHSKYLFEKAFLDCMPGLTYHIFCKMCGNFILKFEEKNRNKIISARCPNIECNHEFQVEGLKNDGNFFITIPMKPQLQNMLDDPIIQESIERTLKNIPPEDVISDIHSGSSSSQKLNEHAPNSLSYTFNTDGAQVFKSSPYSIWPLYISINQIPPKERSKHTLLVGLWFGNSAPDMNLFLKEFVDEANDLASNGVTWKDKNGIMKTSLIFPICCTVDSSARCKILNMKQYNGYFSCPWCYHPGISVHTGNKNEVRFPITDESYDLRTNEEAIDDMVKAVDENTPSRGFKGSSILINLPHFDVIHQNVPDYMHAVLLGVTRTITFTILENTGEPYYIGTPQNIREIDYRLQAIQPPCTVPRNPRSIKERRLWKASEWRLWLLFYSLPCFKGILPDKYCTHFKLLSEAIYILTKTQISNNEVHTADIMLYQFVCDLQLLYGETFCTYNVHLLTHLGHTVLKLGPLWAHSAFDFETKNGVLIKLIKGTTGVPQQCGRKYILYSAIPAFVVKHKVRINCGTERFLAKLNGKKYVISAIQADNTTALGIGKISELAHNELHILGRLDQQDNHQVCYNRAIVSGIVFTTSENSRLKKTDDSCFYLNDNHIGKISKIIFISEVINNTQVMYFLYHKVILEPEQPNCIPKHLRQVVRISPTISVTKASAVIGKCFYIRCSNDESYVAIPPNNIERD